MGRTIKRLLIDLLTLGLAELVKYLKNRDNDNAIDTKTSGAESLEDESEKIED